MSPSTFSFKGRLAVAYWQSSTVHARTIWQMLSSLRERLPHVNTIVVKTNSGKEWMGGSRPKKQRDLRIEGPGDLRRWAQLCAEMNLTMVAWCVVQGIEPSAEVDVIAQVCNTPGVAAMILDVEEGESYFQGDSQVAQAMAADIRRKIGSAHVGLCFDPRGRHPKGIFIDAWMPYMDSLHPMVYPETFQRDPVLAVRDAFNVLSPYNLPVTTWLGAHSLKDTGSLLRAVPAVFEHAPRAEGLVLWRYGDDVMGSREFSSVNRIRMPDLIDTPPPSSHVVRWRNFLDDVSISPIMMRLRQIGHRIRAGLTRR